MLVHTRTSYAHTTQLCARSSARCSGTNTQNWMRQRESVHACIRFVQRQCVARVRRWLCFTVAVNVYWAVRRDARQKRNRLFNNNIYTHTHAYTMHSTIVRSVGRTVDNAAMNTSIKLYVHVRALRAYAFLYSRLLFIFSCRFFLGC